MQKWHWRHSKPRCRKTVGLSRTRDGLPVYNADTFRDAIKRTQDYVKWLLEELPPEYELRIHGLLDAMFPPEWLTDEAVIKTEVRR